MLGRRRSTAALAIVLALAIAAPAAVPLAAGAGLRGSGRGRDAATTIVATLTQCVTSSNAEERSATFTGEMSAVPGTARMAMRIEFEERLPQEALFHTVVAPGVGTWQDSNPKLKVKVFRYLKQVTDLSAPARYRATLRFRWMNAHGATIRRASRVTKVCTQPAVPAPSTPASSA